MASETLKADVQALKALHGKDLRRGLRDLCIEALPSVVGDGSWIAFGKLVEQVLSLDEGLDEAVVSGADSQERLVAALAKLPAPVRRVLMAKAAARTGTDG
jgi:hypothetical protein